MTHAAATAQEKNRRSTKNGSGTCRFATYDELEDAVIELADRAPRELLDAVTTSVADLLTVLPCPAGLKTAFLAAEGARRWAVNAVWHRIRAGGGEKTAIAETRSSLIEATLAAIAELELRDPGAGLRWFDSVGVPKPSREQIWDRALLGVDGGAA